jgi:hypothetical protein
MTNRLVHSREQRPVGQGFFHSSCIRAASPNDTSFACEPPFRQGDMLYIYDCGTMLRYKAALTREIGYICHTAKNKKIDLLFISHFRVDHVNGLPRLLDCKSGLHVDTIVMPLIDHIEMIMLFAYTLTHAATASRLSFYKEVVSDPVATLARFNPRLIVLVRRSKSDGDAAPDGIDIIELEGGVLPDDGRCDPIRGEAMLRWKLVGRGHVSRRNTQSSISGPLADAVYEMDDTN